MKNLSELKKQVIKFGIIGVVAVLTDLVCYYLLLNTLPEKICSFLRNEELSKGISFICGATVTYNLNKIWTWRKNDSSKIRFVKFMLLYFVSLAVNVTTNSLLLFLLHKYESLVDLPNKYFIAFIGATGVSALMNFIGQKYWVFQTDKNLQKKQENEEDFSSSPSTTSR